jgi:acyl carrier protein
MPEASPPSPASFPRFDDEQVHEVMLEIAAIARRELEREGPLHPQLRLDADLGLDSLELTVMAVGLENRFRIRLQEQDGHRLETLRDLAELVLLRRQEAGA